MGWLVLGESVTGTSHRARYTVCQDAFRYTVFGQTDEVLAIAVADGAGSASHSDLGARVVCEDLVRRIVAGDAAIIRTREEMTVLFTEVRASLILEAARMDVPLRQVACTAILAVVGTEGASFAQVGDGAIVVGNGESYKTVFWPEPKEYANATDFLTDERFADTLAFDAFPDPPPEIAVFTDGLQRLALDFATRAPHLDFFRPLLARVRSSVDAGSLSSSLREFLDSQRINQRTDDDKTLVLATRIT